MPADSVNSRFGRLEKWNGLDAGACDEDTEVAKLVFAVRHLRSRDKPQGLSRFTFCHPPDYGDVTEALGSEHAE